ncbi:hypothetical protein EDC19_0547 [Natranaerovirga hydrolytica]|uniref:Uncharacterized protein n=1 Tax=Natranaerovirga hydrolytica TaxID=680378 RepID=A0A4R1N572_9FIRM|nr:hypothetical protein [Natranaerovirga hydrolytica]TCK98129.1 hypothetical protein EDC19_0547 [Natranaerovirga hydrolytica]
MENNSTQKKQKTYLASKSKGTSGTKRTKTPKSVSKTPHRSSARSQYARSQNRSRSRQPNEPTLNFFKVKTFISVILLIFIVVVSQTNVKIGDLASENLFDMLYYNEELNTLGNRFYTTYNETFKRLWNQ